jgi:hypothetical protein
MLDEKNDNLSSENLETDGNSENQLAMEPTETPTLVSEEVSTLSIETESEPENKDVTNQSSGNDAVLKAIDESNAEESEDETLKERHSIPLLDYAAMSMEALVSELEKLSQVDKVMSIKEHVEEIKKEFLSNTIILLKKNEMNS